MKYEQHKQGNTLLAFIALAFCALFIPFSLITATEKEPFPKIEFDAIEKDLGTIAEGDDRKFEFIIKNVGGAELKISRLRSLCDCVDVVLNKRTIGPGSSSTLRGIFRSAGRWGREEKVIIISSNARNAAQAVLKIRLVVESGIRVTPRSLSFGEIARNRSATRKVKIEAQLPDELKIMGMEVVPCGNVTASILKRKVTPLELPRGENGYLTEIDILLKAENNSAGEFSGQLNIQTNSSTNPQIQILFSGEKNGDLEAIPPVVHFKDVIPGHKVSMDTTVKSLGNGPFRVTGLDAGQLPVAMRKVIDKALYEHHIKLVFSAPEKPRHFYRGYVYIITDHPTQKRIKVGVNAVTRFTAD